MISYPKYGNQTPFFLTAVDASCFFRGNENHTNVYFLTGKVPAVVRDLFAGKK